MDKTREDESEGAPAPARARDAGAPSGGAGPERRFSAPRKLAAVTRLLRGEPRAPGDPDGAARDRP